MVEDSTQNMAGPPPSASADMKTLLIVDDMPANVAVMRGILRPYYHIKIATNGKQALSIAQGSEKPDLVLLDISMPEMDGLEVCRRLQQNPETQDIPVIFVTALSDTTDEAEGLALGAVDYIKKPVSPNIVLARVRTHLALRQARLQLAEQYSALQHAMWVREDVERIVRHDLKGPLNAIIGYPQLIMLQENPGEALKENLNRIIEAGHTMLQLIDSGMSMVRMEHGTYEVKPEEVDIPALVQQVCGEMDSLAATRHIRLVQVMSPKEAAKVWGEGVLVHSALSNIVKNAIEASPLEASVTIEVKAEGGTVTIAVENPGTLTANIKERFFDKYVTSGKENGTGLGTYSARLVTEAQGGRLELDTSSPGCIRLLMCLPQMP